MGGGGLIGLFTFGVLPIMGLAGSKIGSRPFT